MTPDFRFLGLTFSRYGYCRDGCPVCRRYDAVTDALMFAWAGLVFTAGVFAISAAGMALAAWYDAR